MEYLRANIEMDHYWANRARCPRAVFELPDVAARVAAFCNVSDFPINARRARVRFAEHQTLRVHRNQASIIVLHHAYTTCIGWLGFGARLLIGHKHSRICRAMF